MSLAILPRFGVKLQYTPFGCHSSLRRGIFSEPVGGKFFRGKYAPDNESARATTIANKAQLTNQNGTRVVSLFS